jgi:hypothetical protein
MILKELFFYFSSSLLCLNVIAHLINSAGHSTDPQAIDK